MKETRAVVAGLVVVVLVALVWGFFRRPAVGMHRVRAFRVQFDGDHDGHHKHVSVRIPGFLVGKVSSLASQAWEDGRFSDWNFDSDDQHARITPRDILDAADKSEPGHPTPIVVGGNDHRIEVSREGGSIRIVTFDRDRRDVEIVAPRALIAGLAQERPISLRELLRRIDELGPGELVTVTSEDGSIRVTAEAR